MTDPQPQPPGSPVDLEALRESILVAVLGAIDRAFSVCYSGERGVGGLGVPGRPAHHVVTPVVTSGMEDWIGVRGIGGPGGKGDAPPPKRPAKKADPVIAALKRRLGCTLTTAVAQVRALRADGWGNDKIMAAIEEHGAPGLAPWTWTERVVKANSTRPALSSADQAALDAARKDWA